MDLEFLFSFTLAPVDLRKKMVIDTFVKVFYIHTLIAISKHASFNTLSCSVMGLVEYQASTCTHISTSLH